MSCTDFKAVVEAARDNTGVKGRYKIAAGIYLRSRLLVLGINSYKTHPIMLSSGYRREQIHLHAEADALQKFLRILPEHMLERCHMHVARVGLDGTTRLAKPCEGCYKLLVQYRIGGLSWTT